MPAAIFPDEESPLFDPDDLKMPESPQHRQISDLIGLAAASLLGSSHQVFRDMNWYPSDGGPAMAPDVMVLPAGAWVPPPDHPPGERLKSYRQDLTGGPPPVAALEVASGSDEWWTIRTKARRCQALGTVSYIVSPEAPWEVLRLAPETGEDIVQEHWLGKPVPELGGLRIIDDDGELTVVLPDDTMASSDQALLAVTQRRAYDAEQRADDAEERAAALARRLRSLGVEPES